MCRESKAYWADSYEKRIDPNGKDYYWLTGNFVCNDKGEDTDIWALDNGYVSVVPTQPDYTSLEYVKVMKERFE